MDNQPNFAERTERLKKTACLLKEAAETVLTEVQHMEAAAVRFKQRVDKKMSARQRTQR